MKKQLSLVSIFMFFLGFSVFASLPVSKLNNFPIVNGSQIGDGKLEKSLISSHLGATAAFTRAAEPMASTSMAVSRNSHSNSWFPIQDHIVKWVVSILLFALFITIFIVLIRMGATPEVSAGS